MGKTIWTKFVAWMNGLSVVQLKLTRKYNIDDFDADLRRLLKRAGCDGEHLVLLLSENMMLESSFLERINALLASGEIPGLYEGEELNQLLAACRSTNVNALDHGDENSEEELYRDFIANIQRNVHLVLTMQPASNPVEFQAKSVTSPALFNRCVVNWMGTWSEAALVQIATGLFASLDLDQHCPVDQVVQTFVQMYRCVDVNPEQRTCPRDFIDWTRHFRALFLEKQQALEERQLHVTVGMSQLSQTSAQVATLRQELLVKQNALGAKELEANAKLQQIVRDQAAAESEKVVTTKLQASLNAQEAEVERQQVLIRSDLSSAEPALIQAQDSVSSIKKSQLDEIRALARPPAVIRLTVEAVGVMLGESSLEWTDLRKFLRRDDFLSNILNFQSTTLSDKVRKVVQTNYFDKFPEDFVFEKVKRASKACGPLFQWISSQLRYCDILHRIQPLRDQLASCTEELESCQANVQAAALTIVNLETSIDQYKHEYAQLIQEAQTIQQELSSVENTVKRSQGLLANLSEERSRWTAQSQNFKLEQQRMIGNALLGSGFCTFGGTWTTRERQIMKLEWMDCLTKPLLSGFGSMIGRHNVDEDEQPPPDDSELGTYLASAAERWKWENQCGLPRDERFVENMAIFTRRQRPIPVFIDPSGVALDFLQQLFSTSGGDSSSSNNNNKQQQQQQQQRRRRQLFITSFCHDAFPKLLANAVRFGHGILIQDAEHYDPILNPILNQEIMKLSGRSVVEFNGEAIDYSPAFECFLLTRRKNDVQLLNNIPLSRCTVLDCTMTSSSVTTKCLTTLLHTFCPQVERQRQDVLRLELELRVKIRTLENELLNELNGVEGSLLDSVRAMDVLETLQLQTKEAVKILDQNATLKNSVTSDIAMYSDLARHWSEIWTLLSGCSRLSSVYAFDLDFFWSLVTDVVSAAADPRRSVSSSTDDDDGVVVVESGQIQMISQAFHRLVMQRCGPTFGVVDKLVFALRLNDLRPPEGQGQVRWTLDEMEHLCGSDFTSTSSSNRRLHVKTQEHVQTMIEQNLTKSYWTPERCETFAHLCSLCKDLRNVESLILARDWSRCSDPEQVLFECLVNVNSSSNIQWQHMLFIKTFRPDRVVSLLKSYCAQCWGPDMNIIPTLLFSGGGGAQEQYLVMSDKPTLLLCSAAYDPSMMVLEYAQAQGTNVETLAMGSSSGLNHALALIRESHESRKWILIQNLHLCPRAFLDEVESELFLQSSKERRRRRAQTRGHVFFTCHITSEEEDSSSESSLPRSFLECCDKVRVEPPQGLLASITRQLDRIPESRLERSSSSSSSTRDTTVSTQSSSSIRRHIYFCLAWVHGQCLERLRYLPWGWTRKYEFTWMDFKVALDVLDDAVLMMTSSSSSENNVMTIDDVPWATMRHMLKSSIYSGHLVTHQDQLMLNEIIDRVFHSGSFDGQFIHECLLNQDQVEEEEEENSRRRRLVETFFGQSSSGTKSKQDYTDFLTQLFGSTRSSTTRSSPSGENTSADPRWLGLSNLSERHVLERETALTLDHYAQMMDVFDHHHHSGSSSSKKHEKLPEASSRSSSSSIVTSWKPTLDELVKDLTDSTTADNNNKTTTMMMMTPVDRFLAQERNLVLTRVRDILEHFDTSSLDLNHHREIIIDHDDDDDDPHDHLIHTNRMELWMRQVVQQSRYVLSCVTQHQTSSASSASSASSSKRMCIPEFWLGGFVHLDRFLMATRQWTAEASNAALDDLVLAVSWIGDTVVRPAKNHNPPSFRLRHVRVEGGVHWHPEAGRLERQHDSLEVTYESSLELVWIPRESVVRDHDDDDHDDDLDPLWIQVPLYFTSDRQECLASVYLKTTTTTRRRKMLPGTPDHVRGPKMVAQEQPKWWVQRAMALIAWHPSHIQT